MSGADHRPAIDHALAGIDRKPVTRWLAGHVDGLVPPVDFDLISGGRSNLTYRVTDAVGAVCVLRRPPTGGVLATAHDMSREWRFISVMAPTAVPVAAPLAYCADADVTGAEFYVMGYVDGQVLGDRDAGLALVPGARATAGEQVVDVLVALHALDPAQVGLVDMVRRTGYVERQLRHLRLRCHRLAPAVPYSDETRALRTVVRTRDELVGLKVAAVNQLAVLLDAYWPGAKARFKDVESAISLDFLTRYPTPASARHLGEKRMTAFLVSHGYSGRRPAAQLLERLRSAPPGAVGEAAAEALRDAVLALVAVLRAVNASVKDLDRSAAAHLGEHPDGKIFASLPRSGQVNAAQMPAERGDCRQAYAGPDSVAAPAGCTPVTSQSGKHRSVQFRWACNKRFRKAMTTFADNSRHASPWAAKVCNDARAAGKDHPHAIRILARAWIRVIWPCWINGVPCDPAQHGAAAALTRQTSGQSAALG